MPGWIGNKTLTYQNYTGNTTADRMESGVDWKPYKTNTDPSFAGNLFKVTVGHWASFATTPQGNKIGYDNAYLTSGYGLSLNGAWLGTMENNNNNSLKIYNQGQYIKTIPATMAPAHNWDVLDNYIAYGGYGAIIGVNPQDIQTDITLAPWRMENAPKLFYINGVLWISTLSWTNEQVFVFVRPFGSREAIVIEAWASNYDIVVNQNIFTLAFCSDKGQLTVLRFPVDSPRIKF